MTALTTLKTPNIAEGEQMHHQYLTPPPQKDAWGPLHGTAAAAASKAAESSISCPIFKEIVCKIPTHKIVSALKVQKVVVI